MVAAALTVWMMFSFWLIAYCAGLPARFGRIALGLVWVELLLLAIWSYGADSCFERTCAPLAQAAGVAARIDVPVLAAAYVVCAVVWLARAGRASVQ